MTSRIERLPVVVIYPHTRCNCRCAMCDIWKRTETGMIEPATFERYLDEFGELGVEWIVFSGGEPLLHPRLDAFCALARERGIRTTILTSGLLLERHAAWIAESVGDVIVSLDGPAEIHDRIRGVVGAFQGIERGTRALRVLQPAFPIAARSTVQKANCRVLRKTAVAAAGLGLDSISFLAADITSEAFDHSPASLDRARRRVGLDPEDLDALAGEVEALIADPAWAGFVRENPAKLRRMVGHFRAALGLSEPVAPVCNAPWVSAVIETDGTVRPCFFHPPIGSTASQPLRAVLNGPAASAFREGLRVAENETCRRCVCSLHYAAQSGAHGR